MSSRPAPLANSSRMCSTLIRVPRIHGLPPRTPGLETIQSSIAQTACHRRECVSRRLRGDRGCHRSPQATPAGDRPDVPRGPGCRGRHSSETNAVRVFPGLPTPGLPPERRNPSTSRSIVKALPPVAASNPAGDRPSRSGSSYSFALSRSCNVAIKIGSTTRSLGRPAFVFTAISVGRSSTRSRRPSSIIGRVYASSSS
jgi:hypothetical protein